MKCSGRFRICFQAMLIASSAISSFAEGNDHRSTGRSTCDIYLRSGAQSAAIYSDQGQLQRRLIRGTARTPLAEDTIGEDRAQTMLIVADHLGSTVATIDIEGSMAMSHLRYPFGKSLALDSSGQFEAPISGYTGKERDLTGYDHFEARYYDPDVSRFTSIDAMAAKYPESSPYSYVNNNPIVNIDPNGHEVEVFARDLRVEDKQAANLYLNLLMQGSPASAKIYNQLSNSTLEYAIRIADNPGEFQGRATGGFVAGNSMYFVTPATYEAYGQDATRWMTASAHEMFHLYQAEMGRDRTKSSGNELEAMLFEMRVGLELTGQAYSMFPEIYGPPKTIFAEAIQALYFDGFDDVAFEIAVDFLHQAAQPAVASYAQLPCPRSCPVIEPFFPISPAPSPPPKKWWEFWK